MKKILPLLITLSLPFIFYAQSSKLNKQDSEKLISYFDNNYGPVMYWNSCDVSEGKTLYQGLSLRNEQIENSNFYNIYTSQHFSSIPYDEKGYITDTMIEISAINIDYLYVYKNSSWINITSILNFSISSCITNINFELPEFKSAKSLPFEDFGYILSSNEGFDFYIKVEERNSEFTEFWLKVISPSKKVKNNKGKWINKGGEYNLMLLKIYCQQNFIDIIKKYIYSRDGIILFKDDAQELQQRIIPQSSIDIARNYICE